MQLSQQDAYILKKLMSKQPVADADPVSPLMSMFMDALKTDTEIGYKLLTQTVGKNIDALKIVMKQDPTTPLILDQRVINAEDLKNLVAPDYVMNGYPFYGKGLNALVGPSGTGKSFVALDFSAHLAMRISSGCVLYVAAEGLHGYASRWEAWKTHNELTTNRLEFYSVPVNVMNADQVDLFINDVQSYEPKMIVFDTVARCMVGGDENSTRDMTQFVDQIDRIRRELGSGALMVHHTGKDGRMRGNTALYAACDSVLFLARSESRIALHNQQDKGGKNKYNKEAPSRFVALRPIDVTVKDAAVSSAVLVDADTVFQSDDDELTSNQKIILDAFGDGGLTGKVLSEITDLNPATIYRNLKKLRDLGLIKQDKDYYFRVEKPAKST